jgi:hypothetical protein
MNEYETIGVYAAFSLIVFGMALIWRKYRDSMKKRFRLLNYHSKNDNDKSVHIA